MNYASLLFIPSQENDYRPRFLQSKALVYCIVFLLAVKIGLAGLSINFPQNIFFADITKNALMNFVNQGRQVSGLAPLAENQKLDQAAQLKAEDMLKNGYFYHVSPTGITPWYWFGVVGYNYKYAGENLAIGFIDSKEVYKAWYNSTSHRENILNPNYKEIGTAILSGFGENKAVVVVQLFGSPAAAETPEMKETQKSVEQPEQAEVKSRQFVLSQSTQAPNNNSYLKYLSLITYNYEEILQNIIYGFIIVVGIAFLLNIFINFNVQRKDLILRAIILMLLLFCAILINKDIIVQIIPHELII